MTRYTKALERNIRDTFTYSHAKNKYLYPFQAKDYDAIEFFEDLLVQENPFRVLMELDLVAFKRAEKIIADYKIPFTPEEKKQAKIYLDVTERMQKDKSDVVAMYQEGLEGTGVVIYKQPYFLTTNETIELHDIITHMPKSQKTHNVVYEHRLPKQILSSKEQTNAVQKCLSNQISVLIGGAGTGKSFVTAAIISQLQANGKTVAVLAPTHKAKEALQDKVNATSTVRTIHSFIHKPDKCDAIVVDESGMLSTPLLLQLLKKHTIEQLVFVGDKNQLPPIEYGRPFERIQKLFPVSELKENHRSESPDIIAYSREILGVPQNANMRIPNITRVSSAKEAYAQGAEIVLTYKNDVIGEINEQQRVRDGIETLSPEFSVGDKIIAITNDAGRFYNGQLFKITHPNRAINLKTHIPITFRSDKDLEYNFNLAYGLTIHKSQGSEWDVVAFQPSERDTQNLAYVAVTRAKKRLIIIGNDIKNEYKKDKEWSQLI